MAIRMRFVFTITLSLLFAMNAFTQEILLGDYTGVEQLEGFVPKEYAEAFRDLQNSLISEPYFTILRSGRYFQKGDRFAFFSAPSSLKEVPLKDGSFAWPVQALGIEHPLGRVVLLFGRTAKPVAERTAPRILLLTRYQGIVEGTPVFSVEQAIYQKKAWVRSVFKLPSAGTDAVAVVADAVRRNVLRIAYLHIAVDATWPPMESIDDRKEIVGFDIDTIIAAADAAGFFVEFHNTAWDGIFAGLDAGKYDAIISSVTITDERKKLMDFSVPYINAGQVLVVRRADGWISGLDDLAGCIVGAQVGTTGAFEIDKSPLITKREFKKIGLAFAALAGGQVDAVVCDLPVAAQYVKHSPEYANAFIKIGDPITDEWYGVAVKKGNKRVLEMVNEGLQAVIGSSEYEALRSKWLW